MCQHYEHRAAESTIDLNGSHHRHCQGTEYLLLLRRDGRNRMLTDSKETKRTPQVHSQRSLQRQSPGRGGQPAISTTAIATPLASATHMVDSRQNFNIP